jgi:hypothetical protein
MKGPRLFLLGSLSLLILLLPHHRAAEVEGQASAVPKVLRAACTDNVCGGCDSRCHDPNGVIYDHLSVHKDGHCACTPRPGGDLDRALQEAYRRWTEQVSR